uniref:Ig_7 domain-containing protein n=1 Tax=Parastrongyloides trichosuri TaxID=131310 RepID=A0A0N4ZD17_PARTI
MWQTKTNLRFNCCISSITTEAPVIEVDLTTTTVAQTTVTIAQTTVTIAPTCNNIANQVMVYVDPSVADADTIFNGGTQEGTSCNLCANTKYFTPATNPQYEGTGGINTYNCPETQPLCLCDDDYNCYTETNSEVSVTLYPYCSDENSCFAYAILDSPTGGEGVADAAGRVAWTSANTLTEDFNFVPVTTANIYMKVTAISCGTCPVALTSASCLPEALTF